MTTRMRVNRTGALLGAGLASMLAAALSVPPWLERALGARLEAEAARRGLSLRVQEIDVSLWPPLRLKDVRLEKAGLWAYGLDGVEVFLRPSGSGFLGRTSLLLGRGALQLPGDVSLELAPTEWNVRGGGGAGAGYRAELEPASALALAWLPAAGGDRFEVHARDAPVGRILTARRAGEALFDAGTLDGSLSWRREAGESRFELDASVREARVAALPQGDPLRQQAGPAFGLPVDATLRLVGRWQPAPGELDVQRWRITTGAADLSGTLRIADLGRDPWLSLSLEVEHLDFGRLLGTLGLDQPDAVARSLPRDRSGGGADREGELGSASVSARVNVRPSDPASLEVSQRIDFTPPRRPLPALERLRGDFVHEVVAADGSRRAIDVSARSPGFIALAEVPPLFVRTLLLGEDTGFFGHRGIDLAELAAAILANAKRDGPARGASTISQQLAKNLFLSRDKELSRKLQELSLALLLEATLGKQRILEIYLNVIEWGPDLYGLRPAARRYFAKEPRDLTPAQNAFLVALIPGPLKYQRSFAAGAPSPAFRRLMDTLLAKLRSVDALNEEQYLEALAEQVEVSPIGAPDEGE